MEWTRSRTNVLQLQRQATTLAQDSHRYLSDSPQRQHYSQRTKSGTTIYHDSIERRMFTATGAEEVLEGCN